MTRLIGWLAVVLSVTGCTAETEIDVADGAMAADAGLGASDAQIIQADSSGETMGDATTRDGSVAAPDGAASGGSCSPSGTVGVDECQYVPNITLYDCDGNPVELHSMCSKQISYLYTFADWCPNCIDFATNRANDFYSHYRETVTDFEMLFVITQTRDVAQPTAASCQEIRERYGLTMPVLYDPEGVTNSVLGMRVNTADLVMREGGLIVINGPWAEFTVTTAIEGGYGECCTSCIGT